MKVGDEVTKEVLAVMMVGHTDHMNQTDTTKIIQVGTLRYF